MSKQFNHYTIQGMKLRAIIASYSSESSARIKQFLNENILEVISNIACSPKTSKEIHKDVLTELVEMHVLKEQAGIVTLNTSVFLENDIDCILKAVTPLAKELSRLVVDCGSAFRDAPPEVTIFLGGIIGLVQGLGATLRQKNIGVDWKSYQGRYAQSKVDFDEVCDIYNSIGPDYLNKSVLPGERYTTVIIGPEPIYKQGEPCKLVVTNEVVQKYESTIQIIRDVTSSYYIGKLHTLDMLLRSTTAGRQGVPPANMMLNLWRYIRKVTATELYRSGFFTDTIPEEGILTVSYENNIELIKQLLG